MQYMTWTKVSYSRTTICTRFHIDVVCQVKMFWFVSVQLMARVKLRWQEACFSLQNYVITLYLQRKRPIQKSTSFCAFLCLFVSILHCFNRRASSHGLLYGGRDASANFTRAFSICIQISRIYRVQAHQYFSCILCFRMSYGVCQRYTQSLTVAIEFCFPCFTLLDIACPPGSLIKNSMW
jgi:hypothetical protein